MASMTCPAGAGSLAPCHWRFVLCAMSLGRWHHVIGVSSRTRKKNRFRHVIGVSRRHEKVAELIVGGGRCGDKEKKQ